MEALVVSLSVPERMLMMVFLLLDASDVMGISDFAVSDVSSKLVVELKLDSSLEVDMVVASTTGLVVVSVDFVGIGLIESEFWEKASMEYGV